MRFYCTSTGPIVGLNCEVLLYFNWSHRWYQLKLCVMLTQHMYTCTFLGAFSLLKVLVSLSFDNLMLRLQARCILLELHYVCHVSGVLWYASL